MDRITIIISIVIGLLFFNNLCMSIYCRIERRIDKRNEIRRLLNGSAPVTDDTQHTEDNAGIGKKIYRWLNSYIYGWVRYNILITGQLPSYRIRKLIYCLVFGMKVTRKTVIFGGCEFRSPWNIELGNCIIGANCILDGRGGIIVEDNVVLGSGVHIWTMQHSINDPYFRTLNENIAGVKICNRAWIASDSMIQPGVTICEGAVLASRAVAIKDCDPFGVYAGLPAIKIAERNRDLRYEHNGKVSWHFM